MRKRPASTKVLWAALPAMIREFVFGAANTMIGSVEAMLNGAAGRIDQFLAGVDKGLGALGRERTVAHVGKVELGGIDNPFAWAAAQARSAARAARAAVLFKDPIAPPNFGLTAAAATALAEAECARGHDIGIGRNRRQRWDRTVERGGHWQCLS